MLGSGPLHIYVPRSYRRGQPGIRAFYDRLFAALDTAGYAHVAHRGRKAPWVQLPRRCYLTYHTHSARPRSGVLHLKLDYVTSYFTLDATGYSGWSSLIDRSLTPDLARGEDVLAEYRKVGTKIATPEGSAMEADRRIIVMGQVFNDTVAVFHRPWEDVFEQAQSLGRAMGCAVSFRPHPKDHGKLEQVARRFTGIERFEGSLQECLSKHVLCVQNSGVGYEGLLSGAPVIAFGRSDYAFAALDGMQEVCALARGVADWDATAALAAVGGMQDNRICSNWSDQRFLGAFKTIFARRFEAETGADIGS
ncbi:MAG: hypothetical protein AAGA19_09615 [Pseudomonadota bacterium]